MAAARPADLVMKRCIRVPSERRHHLAELAGSAAGLTLALRPPDTAAVGDLLRNVVERFRLPP